MMRKRIVRVAAAIAVVGVLLGGGVSPASADIGDTPIDIPAVPGVPDPPSTNDLVRANSGYLYRSELAKKMLTVPSSFLQKLGVTGYQAQAAWLYSAEAVGGASPEKLARMMERSTLSPAPGTTPQTYQDYVLDKHDFSTPVTDGAKKDDRKLRVSPTSGSKFQRMAGGALNVIGAATFLPLIAHGSRAGADVVGGWMGQDDAMGTFCTSELMREQGPGGEFLWQTLNILTGMSCGEMFDNAAGFEPEKGEQFSCITPEVEPSFAPGESLCLYVFYSSSLSGYATTCYVQRHVSGTGGLLGNGPASQPAGWGVFIEGQWRARATLDRNTASSDSFGCYRAAANGQPDVRALSRYGHLGVPFGYYRLADGFNTPQLSGESELKTMECSVTLTDGRTLSAVGPAYRESDGVFQPPPCPEVPDGATVANVAVTDSNGNKVYDEAATPEYTEWRTKYPECDEGACLLDLRLLNGTKLGASCFDLERACKDWFTESDRDTKYQCTYGVHLVEIDECVIYAGIFKPGRVEVGAPYSDPMTGDWTGAANAPRPGKPDEAAMSQAVQNPASVRGCNGMKVEGFDPVGFVMRPIQCALEWAFVPRPLVVEAGLMGAGDAWEKKPPAVIAEVVEGFTEAPSPKGCALETTLFRGTVAEFSFKPVDACPGSVMAPVAAISRTVTTVAFVVLIVIVVRRQISGMVGYHQGQ